MAELRLQPESQHVLTEWWKSSRPRKGDRELVHEVLRTIGDGTWHRRWYWNQDVADNQQNLPVVTIRPRNDLVVLIRFWPADDPPEFELLTIVDVADLPEQS